MPEKILLVEDDLAMRTLLQTFLQLEGFETVLHKADDDIGQVLEMIRIERPAVIVLDVNLRRFNGFDLLAAVRADNLLKHTGVVISSGTDYGERCQDAGADAFILKPYMPDELTRSIRNLIAAKRS